MPSNRRRRLGRPVVVRWAWELAGVAVAAALAVIAVAHALAGAKRSLLLSDGDSVLLPLMLLSAHRGEALEWGMSPVLFVFPELPLYLLAAALTTTVAAALLLNGVFNVVLLYALLRFVAGRVRGRQDATGREDEARPGRQDATASTAWSVAAALVATAVFAGLCLLENGSGGNTGELASLFLTTTYYAGTVMALVASVGLAAHLVGPASIREVKPARAVTALVTLAVVAALATFSNPLYVLWAVIPLVVALAVVTLIRLAGRMLWGGPSLAALALVAGSGIGYLGRSPLQRFVIADKTEYLRWSRSDVSIAFFRDAIHALVRTPSGLVEALLMAVLVAGSVIFAVALVILRRSGRTTLVFVYVAASVVVVPIALILTGTISSRYAIPVLMAPLIGLTAAVARWRATAAPARQGSPVPRWATIVAVAASLAVVIAVVPAGSRVVSAGSALGDPAAACLTRWTAGKHVTGVAQFWSGRPLAAYGGASVRLLQVNPDLTVYPWLVNLASYKNARVSYVIVAHAEPRDFAWGAALTDLGAPRDIVRCVGYDIYDFRGTPGQESLTEQVARSADALAAARGFAW